MRTVTYQTSRLALVALVLFSCALALMFSKYDFSGFDESPMIDIGWRVFRGESPGRDFVVTFPPTFYLLTAAGFKFFGVAWHSLALIACVVTAAFSLAGMRVASIARHAYGKSGALQLAGTVVITQCILLVSINHLWHSSLAQSFAVYAVLSTTALISLDPLRKSLRWELYGHLIVALAGLFLSKPNTAYPAVALVAMVLYIARFGHKRIASLLVAGVLVASLILALVRVPFWRMLGDYAGLTGRFIPKSLFLNITYALEARNGLAEIVIYAVMLFSLKEFVSAIRGEGKSFFHRPIELLAAGSFLIGLLGMATNFDFKLSDMPLVLMGMAIFAVASPQATRSHLWTTRNALLFCFLLSLYFARTRLRMQSVGTWTTEGCAPKTWLHDPFFGEMKVCPVAADAIAEVDDTLKRLPGGTHVFFGPQLEFMYAARGLVSPAHLPNWWDAGTSFPRSHANEVASAWKDDRFDVVVTVPGSLDVVLTGITDDIKQNFVSVSNHRGIEVFVRRGVSLPGLSVPLRS